MRLATLSERLGWRRAAPAGSVRLGVVDVLRGAAVSFDCHVARIADVGTHDVFFCEVLAVDRHFALAAADLPVYVRQSHAERDLAQLGEAVAAAGASYGLGEPGW